MSNRDAPAKALDSDLSADRIGDHLCEFQKGDRLTGYCIDDARLPMRQA